MIRDLPPEGAVRIPAGAVELAGSLGVPANAEGLVLFAHGTAGGRASPRDREVASALRGAGIATLLVDLLTEREALDHDNVFDVGLLAGRLADATAWARAHDATARLAVGYFAVDTGGAAALRAAAEDPAIAAVIIRGGRPDLAGDAQPRVRAATLLIAGENDEPAAGASRDALARLPGPKALEIVPGAGPRLDEPGALEKVIELATRWFGRHLTRRRALGE
jgi:putative phosphoribosyl transferase